MESTIIVDWNEREESMGVSPGDLVLEPRWSRFLGMQLKFIADNILAQLKAHAKAGICWGHDFCGSMYLLLIHVGIHA